MSRIERLAIVGMFALSGTMFAYEVAARAGLRFNVDQSMPLGAYWFIPGPVWRGAVVQACLPQKLADYAKSRGYLIDGTCPTGVMPIVKVLAALPGDTVSVSDSAVSINGQPWPSSAIRSRDSVGRRVDLRLPSGRYTCPPNTVFLMGENPRSWDARYWGCVPRSSVAGRWVPIPFLTRTVSQKEDVLDHSS